MSLHADISVEGKSMPASSCSLAVASSHSSSFSSRPALDDGYSYPEAEKNLNEVLAPPPVFDSSEGEIQQHDYIESRSSRASADQQPENNGQIQGQALSTELMHRNRTRSSSSARVAKIVTYAYLIFFAMIGTLARLVIETLTYYPGAPVTTSVLWANVGGSFIMGFLSEDQALFRIDTDEEDDTARRARHTAHKKGIPLYIGLTTGFCGCLTSFSTFERDVFLALANNLGVPSGPYSQLSLFSQTGTDQFPNRGFNFMAILAVIISEAGLSLASLKAGAHFALFCSAWLPRVHPIYLRRFLDPLVVLLTSAVLIAIICMVILLPRSGNQTYLWASAMWSGPNLFSLVFAPVGCLIRFYLSLKLNRYIAGFPLGTFTANLGGTMILGVAYSLQHAPLGSSGLGGYSSVTCQVLQGIMDGFCGSMTTVSTWVLELSESKRRHAYIYGIISLLVPLALLVIEIGPLRWTKGFTSPVCFSIS